MQETGPDWALRAPRSALDWVARVSGADVTDAWPLGGAFLANHVVVLSDGRQAVLRRWARPDWDAQDPDLDAHREAAVLARLADAPLPAPAVMAADPDGERSDVPALLLTMLPGSPPEGPPVLGELLQALDTLHGIDPEGLPPYRRYTDPASASTPAWAVDSEAWELTLAAAAGPEPDLPERFIHRDPHPGNTLWENGRLTGIVDWTTGARGPAAVDLAHLGANLAVEHGIAASGVVAQHPDRHPYWDLANAVDFAPSLEAPTEMQVARLEAYMRAALGDLSA